MTKKEGLKTNTFIIHPYDTILVIFICDWDTFANIMAKDYHCILTQDGCVACQVKAKYNDIGNPRQIIWLEEPVSIINLFHELIHVAYMVLGNCNVLVSPDSSEALCYLVSDLAERILLWLDFKDEVKNESSNH